MKPALRMDSGFLSLVTVFSATLLFSGVPGTAAPSFQTTLYGTSLHPGAVTIGDFNEDGANDLAVADTGLFIPNTFVSILLGNGDGTFQARTDYPTGQSPFSIGTADFNGDGNLDLVTANSDSNTISVLFGLGDGSFGPTAAAYFAGSYPFKLWIADFDGDGAPDIAVTNLNSSNVSIFLNNGGGTFQAQVAYVTGTRPYDIAVGDINEDGDIDLVIVNDFDSSVSILLGNGNGTFQAQSTFPTVFGPTGVALADLNGDGNLDIAIACPNLEVIAVAMGNGNGTFGPQSTYASHVAWDIMVGDFSLDGVPDIAVSNTDDINGTVGILVGNGDGTVQPELRFAAGRGPLGMAIGDLNSDGRLDIAVADYNRNSVPGADTVAVLINTTTPPPPPHPTHKDQCKNGGYQNYVDYDGELFRNQGQCVSYVNHH